MMFVIVVVAMFDAMGMHIIVIVHFSISLQYYSWIAAEDYTASGRFCQSMMYSVLSYHHPGE